MKWITSEVGTRHVVENTRTACGQHMDMIDWKHVDDPKAPKCQRCMARLKKLIKE